MDDYSAESALNNSDEHFMYAAIEAANVAQENGDVPIGAVIVHKNTIIAKAYNQREQLQEPTEFPIRPKFQV